MVLDILMNKTQRISSYMNTTEIMDGNEINTSKNSDTWGRSFVKAISWRVLGSIDTLIIALFISQDIEAATLIMSVELVTKLILYTLHERGWGTIAWGRLKNNGVDTWGRALVKSLSWRSLGTLDTVIISYILLGDIKSAMSIGAIELVTKMVLYTLHERGWGHINWGKK
jgi:uncharacterized membrane protein